MQVRPVYETLAPLAPQAAAQAMQGIDAARNYWQTNNAKLAAELSALAISTAPSGIPKVPSNSLFPLEDM